MSEVTINDVESEYARLIETSDANLNKLEEELHLYSVGKNLDLFFNMPLSTINFASSASLSALGIYGMVGSDSISDTAGAFLPLLAVNVYAMFAWSHLKETVRDYTHAFKRRKEIKRTIHEINASLYDIDEQISAVYDKTTA